MYRLRQLSPAVFFFLAILLYCSQTCLAAGHASARVTVPASRHQSTGHPPCHTNPTAPQGVPEKCPNCRGHVFLAALSSGPETVAASGPFSLSLCIPMHAVRPGLPQPHADMLRLDNTTPSPPRYLIFSVLQL